MRWKGACIFTWVEDRADGQRRHQLLLVLAHLRQRGLPVTDAHLSGRYGRWSGDALEMNRGEILLLEQ